MDSESSKPLLEKIPEIFVNPEPRRSQAMDLSRMPRRGAEAKAAKAVAAKAKAKAEFMLGVVPAPALPDVVQRGGSGGSGGSASQAGTWPSKFFNACTSAVAPSSTPFPPSEPKASQPILYDIRHHILHHSLRI